MRIRRAIAERAARLTACGLLALALTLATVALAGTAAATGSLTPDPAATPAPSDPAATPAPSDPAATPAPSDPAATPAPDPAATPAPSDAAPTPAPSDAAATRATSGATATRALAPGAPAPEMLSHGRFRHLALYAPAAPTRVVLLLSDAHGFDASGASLAAALAADGALVAGIDLEELEASFAADGGECAFADGDLENLAHFIEAYRHLPTYQAPLLVGYGAGATLAYAVLAQAPAHTFAGALTVGFCPTSSWRVPLCAGEGLTMTRAVGRGGSTVGAVAQLHDPWVDLEAAHERCDGASLLSAVRGAARAMLPLPVLERSTVARWLPPVRAAVTRLASGTPTASLPPPPAALGDLPLIEVAARSQGASSAEFAILLSGDGGWAGLDKEVAQALAQAGIPVVGLDSLRYFWSARTPESLAADLDRVIRHYLAAFSAQRVLLIGYSQGANVLPFAVNRLPEATRARVALTALLGLSEHALFEFHVSSWLSEDTSGPSTVAEIGRMRDAPVLCLYGADESDSPCPKLDRGRIKIVKLAGGHHFNGDYADLAREILRAAAQ